jgi:hypothetical protein
MAFPPISGSYILVPAPPLQLGTGKKIEKEKRDKRKAPTHPSASLPFDKIDLISHHPLLLPP